MKKLLTQTIVLFACLIAFPIAALADTWWECKPTAVEERSNRVQVECSNSISLSGDSVNWVSILKSDADRAARFISLATAALLSGKSFRVYIPTENTTNISGCSLGDCRTPTVFGVKN